MSVETEKKSGPGGGPVLEVKIQGRPPTATWMWFVFIFLIVSSLIAWFMVARMQLQLAVGVQNVERESRWYDVATAPGSRFALITPTPSGYPDLRGRAIYDPASRCAIIVFERLVEPEDHEYVLWAVQGEVSSKLLHIRPDRTGYAVVRIEDAGKTEQLNAFAVSLESVGDPPSAEAPKGPVVMLGALER
jgi:hypothetical protein